MNMGKYLPLYSKGESGSPALFSDPACIVNVLLYKKDGSTFRSDDMYGHLCTKVGALSTPQGMFFDGSDDHVEIADTPVLDTLLTFEAWYNAVMEKQAAPTSNRMIIQKHSAWYHGLFIMWYVTLNGTMILLSYFRETANTSYSQGLYTCTTATFPNWFHLVGMFKNGKAYLYVNGRLHSQGNVIADCGQGHNASPLYIGGDGSARGCYGYIGEVRAYSRTLTDQEVSELYLATRWRYQ
jgi:hypothetical protein